VWWNIGSETSDRRMDKNQLLYSRHSGFRSLLKVARTCTLAMQRHWATRDSSRVPSLVRSYGEHFQNTLHRQHIPYRRYYRPRQENSVPHIDIRPGQSPPVKSAFFSASLTALTPPESRPIARVTAIDRMTCSACSTRGGDERYRCYTGAHVPQVRWVVHRFC